MKSKANILIIDDDTDVLESARMFLKHEFSKIDTLSDPAAIPSRITRTDYDIYLLDMNFSRGLNDGNEGMYWLSRIREIDPSAVVILITAYGDVDIAVRAIKEGATDFVLKPWKNQRLLATITSALALRRSTRNADKLRQTNRAIQEDIFNKIDFIGTSPAITRIKDLIRKVGPTDANVLILGENGTGKELVARSLHLHSSRKENPFIHLDLGAVSPALFESELFGHLKGSFTDAREDRMGRMEMATEGTLFLDELGNLPVSLQVKLLSALQQKEIIPVGGNHPRPVDFRLITATNQPLYTLADDGDFREDLLYRINTVEIVLPPLRERTEDVPELLAFFLEMYARKYNKSGLTLDPGLIRQLQHYAWPGNIRELRFATERAVILTDSNNIDDHSLFLSDRKEVKSGNAAIVSLDEKEKSYILEVLAHCNGNVTQAAGKLGLTRTAMYRRLNKYNIR